MFDILLSGFMLRGLAAAAATGLAAPAVGTYLVQRRLSLMGDGIGHISVTGVALGLLTGASPTLTAVVVAVLGAVAIELIRASGRASGDVALALIFYGGLAGGLVLASFAGNGALALQSYLFGSITTLSATDVWVSVGLAAVVITLCLALLPQLFSVSNDEDYARTSGLPVRFYNVTDPTTLQVTATAPGLTATSSGFTVQANSEIVFADGFEGCRL